MLERRLLLAALATTIAMPAFAQTAPKETSSGAAPKAQTGSAEQKHLAETMAAGAMSLAASRTAMKKARDEDVKEFAAFEVAEQETMADVLSSMQDPSKASGNVNKPSDAEVRQHIAKDDLAMLEKMEQMDGKTFDEAYVKAQVDGHQKLLRIQEDYLANGKDAAHIAIAKLARGQIKEHLALLADIRDDDDDKNATSGQSKKK